MTKSKRKIAIISSSFPPYGTGGVTTSHFNLYRMLKKKYSNIRVFTFYDLGKNKTFTNNIVRFGSPKIYMDFVQLLSRISFGITDPGKDAFETSSIFQVIPAILKMNKALSRYNPDFVIIPDHTAPALFFKKPIGSKMILISHHNPRRFSDKKLFPNRSIKDINIAVRLENIALRKIDYVICPSNYMKSEFIKTYKYNKSISVIHNVLDESIIQGIKPFDLHKRMGLNKNSKIIYVPSAGNVYKGSLLLPEIIEKILSNTKEKIGFYLSGDISEEKLERIKKISKNVRIFAPGKVDYLTNISFVKGCDFAISPTLIENFSMAILEASFCGLPTVSFITGGVPEIIKDGENGFLVKCPNISFFAKKTKLLLDDGKLSKMKKSATEVYKKKFHSTIIIKDFQSLLK